MGEPGLHGRLVAEVARQVNHADLRMIGGQVVKQFGTAVVRSIVDEDDLLPRARLLDGIANAAKQFGQNRCLVVNRQHGGN